MKLRSYNLIFGIFAMSIMNVIYFFWMPYPKSFLKTVGSTTFVFDIITNLLYFIIYSVMFIVVINAITNTGCRLRTKKALVAMGACIAVQLGCDITRYVAVYLTRKFSPISDDFFTVASILLLFLVVVKILGVKTINYKKLFAIFVPTMITALIVCLVFDIRYIHSVSDVAEKYFSTPTSIISALSLLDSSSVASTISKNMKYMYEIRNAILDFVAEATILFAVYFANQTKITVNCETCHTNKTHFVSRIVTMLLLSSLICGLKFFVLPQNFLTTIHMKNSASHSTEPSFDYNRTFTTISRATGYHKKREIYRKTHGTLYYGDKKVLDIYMDYEFEGNPIEVLTVDGLKIRIICKNQAIAYLKDEKPYVVSFQDINKQSNDVILLEVCKELLSEGRLDCFEYICAYIMQYDPSFIQPYLQRYMASEYTTEELSHIGDISTDYITKTAQWLYGSLSVQ